MIAIQEIGNMQVEVLTEHLRIVALNKELFSDGLCLFEIMF